MGAKERAVALLDHYLSQVYEKTGLGWDADNCAEVEEIVDALIAAVRESGAK